MVTILLIALFYGLYSEGYDRLWTAHFLTNFTFPPLGHLKPIVWFGIISVIGMVLTLGATEIVRRWVNIAQQHLLIRALFVINAIGIVCIFVFALVRKLLCCCNSDIAIQGLSSIERSCLYNMAHTKY